MPKSLPVFQTAKQAWLDITNALPAMPIPTVAALLVIFIHQLASELIVAYLLLSGDMTLRWLLTMFLKQLALDLVLAITLNFFLVPFYIAIHRYIILGETTTRYSLTPGQSRFQRFFAWSTAPQLLVPVIVAIGTIPIGYGFFVLVSIFLMIAFVLLSVWLIPLFPAIAVESPGASWRNALHDTTGNFWRIVGTGIVVSLPLLLVSVVLTFGIGPDVSWIWPVIATLWTALTIATASRIYLALGDQLTREDPAA